MRYGQISPNLNYSHIPLKQEIHLGMELRVLSIQTWNCFEEEGGKRWNIALCNQRKGCMGEGQKANLVAQGLLLFDMIDGKKWASMKLE